MAIAENVCVGIIVGAHGLKGEVRLRSFTDTPEDIMSFGELSSDQAQQTITITALKPKGDIMIAKLAHIQDRTAAEALKGVKLYVRRALLPAAEDDQYYHTDLIGLSVLGLGTHKIGEIKAVHNFGAGDILEIKRPHQEDLMVPFTHIAVPEIDISAGYVRIDGEMIQMFDRQTSSTKKRS